MDRHVSVAEPIIGDAERENLRDVLESGRYLQGPYVREFEEKWADFVGNEHAIAVCNGTAAIQLSLNAIGLEPGDEVIVPSLTFGSTATAVVHQAGVPVFADIDPDIFTLDHTDLEHRISDRTKAILPVHLYGHPAEMDALVDLADEHDIVLIEDAAQAHGAAYKGDRVGSIGDVGCFSFYATKNITTGEGGIITTDDDEVAERLRLLRNHGMANRDEHIALGYNFRMSEFHAAIGTAQIDRLPEFNRRRREISERLFEALSDLDWLEPTAVRDYVDHAYFWAPFRIDPGLIGMSGKELWALLKERGVETRHRYTDPLYDQPVFRDHRGFNSTFPWSVNSIDYDYDLSLKNVEAIAGNVIGLPNHPGLDDEEIEFVIDVVRSISQE